jgi:hypothetical protein
MALLSRDILWAVVRDSAKKLDSEALGLERADHTLPRILEVLDLERSSRNDELDSFWPKNGSVRLRPHSVTQRPPDPSIEPFEDERLSIQTKTTKVRSTGGRAVAFERFAHGEIEKTRRR